MSHPLSFLAATTVLCLLTALPAQANRALAEKSNCLGCHALDTRMVGPAFREVGTRYAGQPDALAQLTASIRQGGSGRWGEMAMPAQADLREADARRLADWILKGAR